MNSGALGQRQGEGTAARKEIRHARRIAYNLQNSLRQGRLAFGRGLQKGARRRDNIPAAKALNRSAALQPLFGPNKAREVKGFGQGRALHGIWHSAAPHRHIQPGPAFGHCHSVQPGTAITVSERA